MSKRIKVTIKETSPYPKYSYNTGSGIYPNEHKWGLDDNYSWWEIRHGKGIHTLETMNVN